MVRNQEIACYDQELVKGALDHYGAAALNSGQVVE
jgi:hypothetical protein